ncbi:MAG: 5'-methylthioadenosine/adenosylhomocysteine nucleosidase [Clostridia bacterium]|nr:5'-methylthioadenosine/adenosylhomocysteine nucleosidase [Clostridia bacterium]
MLGVIAAMEEELETLLAAMEIQETREIAGTRFHVGALSGRPAVAVRCGIGKVNAGACAQVLITVFGAQAIVNTGAAGSLCADIDIGDLVVSTDAVQHDMDVVAFGYPLGEVPGAGVTAFPADEALRAQAAAAARVAAPECRVFEGRVCSGDQFIASESRKRDIAAKFNGLCCEMEGAAIAQVCWQNRVPFVILRAISDKAGEKSEISFDQFLAVAAKRSAATVLELARVAE